LFADDAITDNSTSSTGSVPGFKDIDRKVSLTDAAANKSKEK
jgi:formylmethanofuran dehydrogenase subunit D